MLKDGIIGVEKLERYLKVEKTVTKNPEPLKFNKEKLNRVIPSASLQSYDQLLVSETKNNITGEDEGDGN